MTNKTFTLLFVLLAVVVASLGAILPPSQISKFMMISNFFNTMLPILGVGALLKYLCGHCKMDT